MPSSLQIFAPLDLGWSCFSSQARANLQDGLMRTGWQRPELRKVLDLDEQFYAHHAALHYDLTPLLHTAKNLQQPPVNGGGQFCRAEVWLQPTGVALLACTYDLTTAPDSSVLLQFYDDLSGSQTSHFRFIYCWAAAQLEQLPGCRQKGELESLRRDVATPATGWHWTHGIFLHSAQEMLPADTLKALSRGNDFQEYSLGANQVRVSFGWQTTGISSQVAGEVENIARLVRVLGYVWEFHYVLDSLATGKIAVVEESGMWTSLRGVRQFRQCAATLLDLCQVSRLTMTDRYVHMIESIAQEWHLANLKESVKAKLELLTLLYGQLTDERLERRHWQFGLFLAIVALASLISVTTDAVKFFNESPYSVGDTWFLLFGPAGIMLVFLIMFAVWQRWYYS